MEGRGDLQCHLQGNCFCPILQIHEDKYAKSSFDLHNHTLRMKTLAGHSKLRRSRIGDVHTIGQWFALYTTG